MSPNRLSGSDEAQLLAGSNADAPSHAATQAPVVSIPAMASAASLPLIQLPETHSAGLSSEAYQAVGQDAEHESNAAGLQSGSWTALSGAEAAGAGWLSAMVMPADSRGRAAPEDVETGGAGQSQIRHTAAWGPPIGARQTQRGERSSAYLTRAIASTFVVTVPSEYYCLLLIRIAALRSDSRQCLVRIRRVTREGSAAGGRGAESCADDMHGQRTSCRHAPHQPRGDHSRSAHWRGRVWQGIAISRSPPILHYILQQPLRLALMQPCLPAT